MSHVVQDSATLGTAAQKASKQKEKKRGREKASKQEREREREGERDFTFSLQKRQMTNVILKKEIK